MTTALYIYLLTVLVLLAISFITFFKVPQGTKLPMQWGIDGQVGWSASAKWAVLTIPILAMVTFAFAILIMSVVASQHSVPSSIHRVAAIITCITFVPIHMGHMYFALRHIKRG